MFFAAMVSGAFLVLTVWEKFVFGPRRLCPGYAWLPFRALFRAVGGSTRRRQQKPQTVAVGIIVLPQNEQTTRASSGAAVGVSGDRP
jgi:hypothetical protein